MRHVHNLSVEAIAALDTAISSLETAKTYETIDAFSSNNAISVMSTVQTSSASDDVQEANAAIGRLREASRQEVPASLSAPSDAFDLMMDLCIDSVFDFMSFYNMKRLGDAKTRCHQARDRVMEIERALLRDVQKAATAADPVRTALSDLRATYALKASKELPAAARKYVR